MEEKYVHVPVPWPLQRFQEVGVPVAFNPLAYRPGNHVNSNGRSAIGQDGGFTSRTVRVRYVVEGEGPAVVMVHGLGASLAIWGDNIRSLAKNHRVYALDMPGYGMSDKSKDLAYNAIAGGYFIVWFMDTLGIRSATLIGNSAGGLMSAIAAVTYPHRVEKLALVSSAGLGRSIAWFIRLASLPGLGEFLHLHNVGSTRHLMKGIFHEPRSVSEDLMQELMHVRNLGDAKRAALESIRSGVNLWGLKKKMMMLPRLKDFMKPMLIVWGQEDTVIPVSHAYQAAKALPHSNLHIIPRCGHWPQLEKPRQFNHAALDFLNAASHQEKKAV
jgi:4,5:9,10-diseco-3-hydroxy-5,9,17-trioxoandrosta-1(10),2-diene-4-oate hydrolase